MLTNEELLQITGGGWEVAAAIGAALTFILGFIDGILKPVECPNEAK